MKVVFPVAGVFVTIQLLVHAVSIGSIMVELPSVDVPVGVMEGATPFYHAVTKVTCVSGSVVPCLSSTAVLDICKLLINNLTLHLALVNPFV